MREIDLSQLKGAIFSEDRKYRYALWRVWSTSSRPLMTIGLNPSTANEITDDPTITRLVARAARVGFGGLLMGNLYALVSTEPDALLVNDNTVGELTDLYLERMIALSSCQLCGWGSFQPVSKRAPDVLKMIPDPFCLGANRDGQPKHPLYIGYDVPMTRYSPRFREGKMNTRDVIKRTKEFRDFYGQDLSDTTGLKTKKDCFERLETHRRFLEDQQSDALQDVDNFERELGIY